VPVRFSADQGDIERIGEEALGKIQAAYAIGYPDASFLADISLVSIEEIQALNAQYRKLDEPTDVLSFPTISNTQAAIQAAEAGEVLIGDIVICEQKVIAYHETLPQMVHHGLLHLLGFDHVTDMVAWQAEEKRILTLIEAEGLTINPVPHDAV
jgi:rRNA maturation RNase YbeY